MIVLINWSGSLKQFTCVNDCVESVGMQVLSGICLNWGTMCIGFEKLLAGDILFGYFRGMLEFFSVSCPSLISVPV